MQIVVTTGQKTTVTYIEKARNLAKKMHYTFVSRKNHSIEVLREQTQADVILVINKQGITAHTPEGELFFHLSMAQLRIKNLIAGKPDHMVDAMQLKEGMKVLDCTLGMAADAITASYVVGATGRVVGLEISPITALVVQDGLQQFATKQAEIRTALERIEVVQADYNMYLANIPDHAFDVVYIDPMFRCPVKGSKNLNPLRFVADHRAIDESILVHATRVARQRVVIKETNQSREFRRLHIDKIVGGKYSSINYGIIESGE